MCLIVSKGKHYLNGLCISNRQLLHRYPPTSFPHRFVVALPMNDYAIYLGYPTLTLPVLHSLCAPPVFQAELFAVAAAVSGKDYWCLSARSNSASSKSNPLVGHGKSVYAPGHHGDFSGAQVFLPPRGQDATIHAAGGGGATWGIGHGHEDHVEGVEVDGDIIPVSPPDVPPSFRAVVITVIAANRMYREVKRKGACGQGKDAGKVDMRYVVSKPLVSHEHTNFVSRIACRVLLQAVEYAGYSATSSPPCDSDSFTQLLRWSTPLLVDLRRAHRNQVQSARES